jgi:competence protein ComGC
MMGIRWSGWRSSERGFLMLIGLLVVLVIIMILYKSEFGGPVGGGSAAPGGPQTMLGGAVDRADQTICRNNLSQLRAAITIYQGNNGTFPPSLEALQSNVVLKCPVGGEPYQYDPATGTVHCTHPGHESF